MTPRSGPIALATINARYAHASLGLRCLRANLGDLRPRAPLVEATLGERPADVAERLLHLDPALVALGVYIWNVADLTRVARILRAVRPDLPIVVGGPEVSHDLDGLELAELATTVVAGPGEGVLPGLCHAALSGSPLPRRVVAEPASLEALALPYDEYDDTDLRTRVLYVEASRGCVYRCSFCLSALDKTATPFPLEPLLAALGRLRDRGARTFKFVDRTFNLDVGSSVRVLDALLGFLDDGAPLHAHFEVVPDRLPAPLLDRLARFPPGSLQLEIGFQTFDPEVQRLVSRRQDDRRAIDNLRRLRAETAAHLHADLVFGLPGETLDSFAAGFDRLVAADPHEIQVGLLKFLRGAPIAERIDSHRLVFDPEPPYTVWSTSTVDFATFQRLGRFARHWDLVGNSGRFPEARRLLLADDPFRRFLTFSDALWARTGATHGISHDRLVDLVAEWLEREHPPEVVRAALARDYAASGARGAPRALDGWRLPQPPPARRRQTGIERQARAAGGAAEVDSAGE